MQAKQTAALKRSFSMREAVTMTVGTVIGVGLFTVGAGAVGTLGPHIFWATLLALGVSIYPALLYAEMGAALPYAGGTYQYARRGLGRPFGMLAGWNFVISMVSVASGEALAFAFYLKTLLGCLGIALPLSDTMVALMVLLGFLVLNLCGVEMTGRMQNGFMFFFWGVTAVWFFTMLPHMDFAGFAAAPAGTAQAFFPCVAMVWWCFAGFETCCSMGEEIRYPHINLPRALFLAPFLVFAVNALFQFVLLCIVPPDGLSALAQAAAPYAEGMRMAGVVGLPLVLLCCGIAFGGDFSTLNASVLAPARYLYTMARDGSLPRCFARLHPKTRVPRLAVVCLGGLMMALVATGSIAFVAQLSLFATLLYYILGLASAWGLRRREPDLVRPYRAPGYRVGVPVSILLYLAMMTQLDTAALCWGAAWSVLGLIVYALCRHKRGAAYTEAEPVFDLSDPPPEERSAMDKSYRHWKTAVIVLTCGVLMLYAVAFLCA